MYVSGTSEKILHCHKMPVRYH